MPPPQRPAGASNATAERAINILLLFNERKPVLTAAEVAEAFDTPRSTTYRYLKSLTATGLLAPVENGGFSLGPRILELAKIARSGASLTDLALPVMRDLVARFGETALLARLSGEHVVCIERVDSPHPVRISYERGQLLPIHAGASAKALIAFLPPTQLDGLIGRGRLTRHTEHTVTDPKRLRLQLEDVRKKGSAVTEGEVDLGVVGVAAPVFGAHENVVASLGVVVPSFRAKKAHVNELTKAVASAAQSLSAKLQGGA